MPSASLNRMTVPTNIYGSDQSVNSTAILMPKLKYRFRVTFQNFGVSTARVELTKQVMDFTRPSVSFEDIPIDIYNSRMYLAGKYTWEMVTVNLRDDASNYVTRLVGEQLQKQLDFAEQASAASGSDYKFTTVCEILDGANGAAEVNPIETWELYGCYLQQANYNDLNYTESAPATVSLTIRFDNANQSPFGVGLGATAGRTVNGLITSPAAVG